MWLKMKDKRRSHYQLYHVTPESGQVQNKPAAQKDKANGQERYGRKLNSHLILRFPYRSRKLQHTHSKTRFFKKPTVMYITHAIYKK